MLLTALRYSHFLLREVLEAGDIAVDATMGRGHDTQLLAELVGTGGHVYAFDVQEQAIQSTKQRLTEAGLLSQVTLIHEGHQNLSHYVKEPIKAAIFNLGYLPRGDKTVITLPASTKMALDTLVEKLVAKGRIVIVSYYGHEGGKAELDLVRAYCESLPQEQFNVLHYQFINQKNQPPILFCIERKN